MAHKKVADASRAYRRARFRLLNCIVYRCSLYDQFCDLTHLSETHKLAVEAKSKREADAGGQPDAHRVIVTYNVASLAGNHHRQICPVSSPLSVNDEVDGAVI